jgi:hypothetical protein
MFGFQRLALENAYADPNLTNGIDADTWRDVPMP